MLSAPNALQWDGDPGHYEVYYVTLTDPATGVGLWIRYTMLASLEQVGEPATCSLWFLAMDPRAGRQPTFGRKASFPISQLRAGADPFSLRIADATISETGITGSFDDVAWNLRWAPAERSYEHVHPALRRAGVAQTVLVLPGADLSINGTIRFAGESIELMGARGGQAHLWGSKHGSSWAWVHCNDFSTLGGEPEPGEFVDAVSVIVRRFGRSIGPNTPVVGRIDGEDFSCTAPLRVIANPSTFALTRWRFEAVDGSRKLIAEVDAEPSQLAGVTYHDPDGERAYCYNGETATMRLHVYERNGRRGGWTHRKTLVAPGRAHFEYAQRTPVPELKLLTQ